MNCRFCQNKLKYIFVDLINSPLSNSFLTKEQLCEPETFYPLKVFVCEKCWLVQIDEYKCLNEIFGKSYAYFSSYSSSWLEHAKRYSEMIIEKLQLNNESLVIEIASNDGYLLQYFKQRQIPCIGIEPSENIAKASSKKGINVIVDFFREELALQLAKKADLIIGNNVLAHVPDIKSFVRGLKIILKQCGVITLEFPHLMNLIEKNQFDTIYHEHFFYFSFHTIKSILEQHNLKIFDVEELPTHGGSLRIYVKHKENNGLKKSQTRELLLMIIIGGFFKIHENMLHGQDMHLKLNSEIKQ